MLKLKHHRHGRQSELEEFPDHYPHSPATGDGQDSDSDSAIADKTTISKGIHTHTHTLIRAGELGLVLG